MRHRLTIAIILSSTTGFRQQRGVFVAYRTAEARVTQLLVFLVVAPLVVASFTAVTPAARPLVTAVGHELTAADTDWVSSNRRW